MSCQPTEYENWQTVTVSISGNQVTIYEQAAAEAGVVHFEYKFEGWTASFYFWKRGQHECLRK